MDLLASGYLPPHARFTVIPDQIKHVIVGLRVKGAHLLLRYVAPRIYVVAAPPRGAAGSLSASVDGKLLPRIPVPHDDLYQLAHLAKPGPHALDLSVRPGTSLYSFTFG